MLATRLGLVVAIVYLLRFVMYIPDEEFAKSRSIMYDALIQMPNSTYQEIAIEFGFGYFQDGEFYSEISVFDLACFLEAQNCDPLQIAKGNWR